MWDEMTFADQARGAWEAREGEHADRCETVMEDLVTSTPIGSPAETILSHLLWHLLDPESSQTDDDFMAQVVADAGVLADRAGVHWRSGR